MKYTSADELRADIEAYFDRAEARDTAPTWPGLLIALDLTEEEAAELEKCDDSGFRRVFQYAQNRRCEYWQPLAVRDPKLCSFCRFQLQQPENGMLRAGFDEPCRDVNIHVNIGGFDGPDPGG